MSEEESNIENKDSMEKAVENVADEGGRVESSDNKSEDVKGSEDIKKVEKPVKETKKKDADEDKHYIMDLKIKNRYLRTIVDAVGSLNKEMLIHIRPDGWKIKQVDPAHVGMVVIDLKNKLCEEYKADSFEIGLDLEKFDKLLKLAGMDVDVGLSYDSSMNVLWVTFDNLRRRLGLIDTVGMPDPKIPNFNNTAEVQLPAGEIMRGFKAAELVADNFQFIAEKKQFKLYNEMDSELTDITWEKDVHEQLARLNVSVKTRAIYSLDYAMGTLKVAHADSIITMNYASDSPIILDYSFEDGGLALKYLIAPRIENQE